MVSRNLGEDFVNGLKAPSYFNGRLLSAEDLQQDQQAMLARLTELGQATGYGIVSGFAVTKYNAYTLRVQSGLGINKKGDIVRLQAAEIRLPFQIEPGNPPAPTASERFEFCVTQGPTAAQIVQGAYVLTAAPTTRFQDFAPVKAVGGRGSANLCASKWQVEGVQFRAIRLDNFSYTQMFSSDQQLRNRLAYWCYGWPRPQTFSPFDPETNRSGLDKVTELTDDDLPLAVFWWNGTALDSVDMWSARRRIVRHRSSDTWMALVDDKLIAEREARFLQFQQHLAEIEATHPGPRGIQANYFFRFIPPVGFIRMMMPYRKLSGLAADQCRKDWDSEKTAGFAGRVKGVILGQLPLDVKDVFNLIVNKIEFQVGGTGYKGLSLYLCERFGTAFADAVVEAWPFPGLDINYLFGAHISESMIIAPAQRFRPRLAQSWILEPVELHSPDDYSQFDPFLTLVVAKEEYYAHEEIYRRFAESVVQAVGARVSKWFTSAELTEAFFVEELTNARVPAVFEANLVQGVKDSVGESLQATFLGQMKWLNCMFVRDEAEPTQTTI